MIAKWANPACRVPFNHHIKRKFFRIHPTEVEAFKIPVDAAEKNARWMPLDRPIVVERPDVPRVFSDPYLSLQISFLNAS